MFSADQMRAYGEACAAAEREACAKVCDVEAAHSGVAHTGRVLNGCAAAIRARSGE